MNGFHLWYSWPLICGILSRLMWGLIETLTEPRRISKCTRGVLFQWSSWLCFQVLPQPALESRRIHWSAVSNWNKDESGCAHGKLTRTTYSSATFSWWKLGLWGSAMVEWIVICFWWRSAGMWVNLVIEVTVPWIASQSQFSTGAYPIERKRNTSGTVF